MTPLSKRLPRELVHNIGKYLGIFLLMVFSIALVSGFLVAASSIERTLGTMRDDYTIEDGRFTTNFAPSDAAIEAVEELGLTVYDLLSYDVPIVAGTTQNATVRVYEERTHVDIAAYAEGRAPTTAHEIALDRVFAAHAGVSVGDTVQVAGKPYTVSGILTLPDYQALFEKNSDFVFNALTFCVAEVSAAGFEELGHTATVAPSYTYAFVLNDRTMPLIDRVDLERSIAEELTSHGAILSDLIDADSNLGITYAAEDTTGDQLMWEVMLFIIVIIMAFVFVILTASTIEEESAVIGTLMAMGYRKRELVLHYLAMPFLVGLAACAVGNVVGYTLCVDPMRDLYYNSYSLPPFELHWNTRAFLLTTVLPFCLLMGITLWGLLRHMRYTPLQFLRHETSRARGHLKLRLPERMSFTSRFRLRVFVRNLSNFVTLFCGIALASLLLLFGLCMLPTMDHYAEALRSDTVAEHQYLLKSPLELTGSSDEVALYEALNSMLDAGSIDNLSTSQKVRLLAALKDYDPDAHPVNTLANTPDAVAQAEKYAIYQLETLRPTGDSSESVTIYGIDPSSLYFGDLAVGDGRVVIGTGLATKCRIAVGETRAFQDVYTGTSYELTPTQVWGSPSNMNVYLALEDFNELFGNESTYFNGYMSNQELALDARYVASDLTPADMDKISAQMTDSMGSMTNVLLFAAVLIYLVLMYLLTKTVIDRSARAISYMKVFGYRDGEISALYVRPITLTVLVSLVACLPLIIAGITALLEIVFMEYNGNIEIYLPPSSLITCVVIGAASYAVIAWFHLRRIKRVPLALALKVQE